MTTVEVFLDASTVGNKDGREPLNVHGCIFIRRHFSFFSSAFSDRSAKTQSSVLHQHIRARWSGTVFHPPSAAASSQSPGPLTGELWKPPPPPSPRKPSVTWPEAEALASAAAWSCWTIHSRRNHNRHEKVQQIFGRTSSPLKISFYKNPSNLFSQEHESFEQPCEICCLIN